MNERIRELATEVGMSVEYLESTKQIVLIERFAQLLVREFANIVKEEIKLVEEFKSTATKADVIKCHQSKIWHFHKLIDKSKKHFGVES